MYRWRTGKVIGHPNFPDYQICTSTPKFFDKDLMQITTTSGRVYQLKECGDNLEKQIAYIEEDVQRCINASN